MQAQLNKDQIAVNDRWLVRLSILLVMGLIVAICHKSPTTSFNSVGHLSCDTPVKQLPARSLRWIESKNSQIFIGDQIVTGKGQKASLALEKGLVTLGSDTAIEIAKDEDGAPEIVIHRGNAASDAHVKVARETELNPLFTSKTSLAMPGFWTH